MDAGVAFRLAYRFAQIARQALVDRIEPLGPVERQPRDASLDLVSDRAPVAHRFLRSRFGQRVK
jgi:hypothetical protein